MTFSGRQPSLDPCMLPTPICGIFNIKDKFSKKYMMWSKISVPKTFWTQHIFGLKNFLFIFKNIYNIGFFQISMVNNNRGTYLFLEKCTYWHDHEANEDDEDDTANPNDHQVRWDRNIHDSVPIQLSLHPVDTILFTIQDTASTTLSLSSLGWGVTMCSQG